MSCHLRYGDDFRYTLLIHVNSGHGDNNIEFYNTMIYIALINSVNIKYYATNIRCMIKSTGFIKVAKFSDSLF